MYLTLCFSKNLQMIFIFTYGVMDCGGVNIILLVLTLLS